MSDVMVKNCARMCIVNDDLVRKNYENIRENRRFTVTTVSDEFLLTLLTVLYEFVSDREFVILDLLRPKTELQHKSCSKCAQKIEKHNVEQLKWRQLRANER